MDTTPSLIFVLSSSLAVWSSVTWLGSSRPRSRLQGDRDDGEDEALAGDDD